MNTSQLVNQRTRPDDDENASFIELVAITVLFAAATCSILVNMCFTYMKRSKSSEIMADDIDQEKPVASIIRHECVIAVDNMVKE
jgi:hypothetical protein